MNFSQTLMNITAKLPGSEWSKSAKEKESGAVSSCSCNGPAVQ